MALYFSKIDKLLSCSIQAVKQWSPLRIESFLGIWQSQQDITAPDFFLCYLKSWVYVKKPQTIAAPMKNLAESHGKCGEIGTNMYQH